MDRIFSFVTTQPSCFYFDSTFWELSVLLQITCYPFFTLNVQYWQAMSKAFLLLVVYKHFKFCSFSHCFIVWLVWRGLYTERKIFGDVGKSKVPGNKWSGSQAQYSCPSTPDTEIITSSWQEWCVAVWELTKETCLFRFCVTKRLWWDDPTQVIIVWKSTECVLKRGLLWWVFVYSWKEGW